MSGNLEQRWSDACEQLRRAEKRHGREPGSVRLIAVSKKHSLEDIETLYHLGQRDFGENYVQELVSKASGAKARGLMEIRWHMIGHLQSNKVKQLVQWVDCVQTIDSPGLVQQLAKRWKESGRPGRLPVLVEVNPTGEETKSGIEPALLQDLVREIQEHGDTLELAGLMCIPAQGDEAARTAFKRLRELAAGTPGLPPQCRLSIGMSSDYDIAIAEGSTEVRIGTAIFGPRPAAAQA